MFTPQGSPRRLPFSLQNQVSDENQVDDAGLPLNEFDWPEDSAERVLFPLYVSLNEYVALSSAIDVGADIAYPLQYIEVMWIWIRQQRYSMDLCALIADCISNSEGTKQALRELIASDIVIQNTIFNSSNGGTFAPETTLANTTDYDALFGAITFLVDTMYDAIVDFNGLAEITTNFRERSTLLFEAIPVIETAPVDEVIDFIDTIYEDVMEVFEAQWSTTPITGSRDRIRCGLFCLARLNDGVLTWEMVKDYFWEQVSFVYGGPVAGVIAQFVAFLGTGNWVGQAVVDISFANFATAMTVGQKFGDLLFPTMETIMQLGMNNPDPDWVTLCVECANAYVYEWDFEENDGGWIVNGANQGIYSSMGWEFGSFSSAGIFYVAAQIKKTVPGDANIDRIELDLKDVVLGLDDAGGRFTVALFSGGYTPVTQPTLPGNNTYGFDVIQDAGEIIVVARASSYNGTSGGGSGRIARVRVYGDNAVLPAFTGGQFI